MRAGLKMAFVVAKNAMIFGGLTFKFWATNRRVKHLRPGWHFGHGLKNLLAAIIKATANLEANVTPCANEGQV